MQKQLITIEKSADKDFSQNELPYLHLKPDPPHNCTGNTLFIFNNPGVNGLLSRWRQLHAVRVLRCFSWRRRCVVRQRLALGLDSVFLCACGLLRCCLCCCRVVSLRLRPLVQLTAADRQLSDRHPSGVEGGEASGVDDAIVTVESMRPTMDAQRMARHADSSSRDDDTHLSTIAVHPSSHSAIRLRFHMQAAGASGAPAAATPTTATSMPPLLCPSSACIAARSPGMTQLLIESKWKDGFVLQWSEAGQWHQQRACRWCSCSHLAPHTFTRLLLMIQCAVCSVLTVAHICWRASAVAA